MSQPDFFPSRVHKSTTLLMQQANGAYKDTARSDFTNAIESGGGQGLLVKGPNGIFYLVSESAWARDGLTRVNIQRVTF